MLVQFLIQYISKLLVSGVICNLFAIFNWILWKYENLYWAATVFFLEDGTDRLSQNGKQLCKILEQQRPQDATTYTIWGNTSILKQGSVDCSFGQGGAFHRDTESLSYDWILWNTPCKSCEIKIMITIPNWNNQQGYYTSGMRSVRNDMNIPSVSCSSTSLWQGDIRCSAYVEN
jgi:hypothetical protein